jgi:hypothetical protein
VPRDTQEVIVVAAGEMVTGEDWQVLRYVSGSKLGRDDIKNKDPKIREAAEKVCDKFDY